MKFPHATNVARTSRTTDEENTADTTELDQSGSEKGIQVRDGVGAAHVQYKMHGLLRNAGPVCSGIQYNTISSLSRTTTARSHRGEMHFKRCENRVVQFSHFLR